MSETDVDRRGYRLVLTSHSVLNGRGAVRADRGFLDWASRNGWGVYQLPEPSHRLGGHDLGAEAHEAEDRVALDFVFSQIRAYLDGGYELAGVVLDPEEYAGEEGRRWLRRLRSSAAATQVRLDRTWIADPSKRDDPALATLDGPSFEEVAP